MPRTAACFSRSAQISWNVSASIQMPSHLVHSQEVRVSDLYGLQNFHGHAGKDGPQPQGRCPSDPPFAPQCEQNFAPSKIIPKHEGHATVASRAPQCSHEVASEAAGAPHIGQFNVSACMI